MLIYLISLITLITLLNTVKTETYTVKSAGIIFRNGVSTTNEWLYPELDYMLDYGPGNLLPGGERMMYRLGQEYHRMYKTLIEKVVDQTKYEVYSYSAPEYLFSASSQAFILGLHGPGTGYFLSTSNKNEKTILPPYEGLTYKFTNSSALP
jgi:hypothetical protein